MIVAVAQPDYMHPVLILVLVVLLWSAVVVLIVRGQ